jgi:parallel beta-helix repeat protein
MDKTPHHQTPLAEKFGFRHCRLMKTTRGIFWGILFSVASLSQAATYVVTSTANSGPGTLREAILFANTNPGPDTINFNIPGSGVQTIAPTNVLPAITNQVFIDGFSQPGSSANTSATGDNSVHLIRLDGYKCLDSFPEGMKFTTANPFAASPASGSTVRGLCIVRFYYGIYANEISNFTVTGNWLGLDIDGIARGNGNAGVYLTTSFNSAANNIIGGTTPAARNIISGNAISTGFGGINLTGTKLVNATIQGNLIGTDQTGTLPRGNWFSGIYVSGCSNVLIGGATSAARNVVSASGAAGGNGITVSGPNHTIQGNYVGTDITGQYDLGNLYDGINVSSASGTKILGNLVVNNRNNGINLSSANGSTVENNIVGTDATGTRPLGNAYAGITISGSTNRIGGLSAGQANTIFFNTGAGVELTSSTAVQNEISGNNIYDNGGLAIDLYPAGINTNDVLDVDTGANGMQNFPVLTNATITFSALTVQGVLGSKAGSNYRLEFFATPTWDATNTPEGKIFLGATNVTTDGSGNAAFTAAINSTPDTNFVITATATDASGNTSEFSAGIGIVSNSVASPSLVVSKAVVSGGGGSGNATTTSFSWPSAATFFSLEKTPSLTAPVIWTAVTSGIVEAGGNRTFTLTNGAGNTNAFYRLKKP